MVAVLFICAKLPVWTDKFSSQSPDQQTLGNAMNNDSSALVQPNHRIITGLMLIMILLGQICQATEPRAGDLVSRGEGAGVAQHSLPVNAIDTTVLPHTYLAVNDGANAVLPHYRLAPNTYFLYGNISTIDDDNRGFNGNAGFVVTDSGVVVIDALGTPLLGQRLIATVRSVSDQPIRYLILTHHHPDHAYGASAFRNLEGVTVIAHPGIRDYLGSETMQRSVDYRRNLLHDDMQGFKLVEPDLTVPEKRFAKYRLELGDSTFDIYNAGQHHSHGDLVVHQVEADIVWISDLAFSQRVTYMGDGNSQLALQGQDWLLEQFPNARLMVPGHGSAQTPPFPMIEQTKQYIERLRNMMQTRLETGVSLLDAVEQSDMPDWQDVPLYDENQRANAGFIYREMEFEVF